MKLSISTDRLQLEYRQVVSFRNGRGTRLHCDSGLLWITLGDNRDILLKAGDSFHVDRDDLVLLNAMCRAQLRLQAAGSPRPPVRPAANRALRLIHRAKQRLVRALICAPLPHWRRQTYY